MIKTFSKPLFWSNVAAFTIAGLFVASMAFGWTNPTGAPPSGSGAVKVDSAGNVGVGLGAGPVTQKLEVNGGKIKSSGASAGFCIGASCITAWPVGTVSVGGSGNGTSGKLAKFTGETSIGDSILTETTGGNVGVGVSSPTKKLDVSGGVKAAEFCIVGSCISSWPATGLTGSGTTGKIPKWTGPSTLGDSKLTEDAAGVAITGNLVADGNLWGPTTEVYASPSGFVPFTADCPPGSFMKGLGRAYLSGGETFILRCAKL